jgi:hypothetical protein
MKGKQTTQDKKGIVEDVIMDQDIAEILTRYAREVLKER